MKEITREFLDEIEKEYLDNDVYTIGRNALNDCKISDLARNSNQSEYIGNNFSINIETLPVCNQKASGRCWIFAGCNVLREKIAKRYNLENFELSQNYVAFYDKLEKCNYLMESIIELLDRDKDDRLLTFLLMNGIQDGGQWDLFVNVVRKYGLVPKDVFPETYQSSNTREIDNVLNRYVRKFAYEARKIKDNINKVNELKEKMMKDIYKILCNCFGVPPKKFSFEYTDKNKNYNLIKDITPEEFYYNYVQVNLDDYVSIINSPTSDKPFYNPFTVNYLGNVIEGNKVIYLNEEIERFKNLIINQLKDGEPVWFGCDCLQSGDREKGIWDDLSFDVDVLFQIDSSMSKEAMLDMRESTMNHAMVITGVNLDENKPTKWKIENSWGEDRANKGYYVATDTWFDQYVYQAVVNKKYLSELERKDLQREIIELNPWDPMGMLAK